MSRSPAKRYQLACVPMKDSDLPAHPHSLITVFIGPSMGSQGSNVFFQGENEASDQTVRMRRLI